MRFKSRVLKWFSYLLHRPMGDTASLHPGHAGKEFTVLLPAQRQVTTWLSRHGWQEDRLMQGLLETVHVFLCTHTNTNIACISCAPTSAEHMLNKTLELKVIYSFINASQMHVAVLIRLHLVLLKWKTENQHQRFPSDARKDAKWVLKMNRLQRDDCGDAESSCHLI